MPKNQLVAPHIIENILLGACPEREAEMLDPRTLPPSRVQVVLLNNEEVDAELRSVGEL
jgi:hypothetical protein